MFARYLSLIATFMVFPMVPAHAADPMNAWSIEPSTFDASPRANRPSNKPITLALKAPPMGSVMQLAIIRHGYRNKASQVDATVTLDGRAFTTYALVYPLGFPVRQSKQSVSLIHLPPTPQPRSVERRISTSGSRS